MIILHAGVRDEDAHSFVQDGNRDVHSFAQDENRDVLRRRKSASADTLKRVFGFVRDSHRKKI